MNISYRSYFSRFPFFPALIILVVVFVLNGIAEPNSLKILSIKGLISTYLALMFLAVAQTVVVYAGDIDLSVGAILGLVNVSVVALIEAFSGTPYIIVIASAVGIGIGILCGVLNGLLVARFRLQAIVATFATSIVFAGVALSIMPVAGVPAPAEFWRSYAGKILGIPFVFYIFIMLLVVAFFVARTKIILQLLCVGDDKVAAYQTGLPVTSVRIKGYAICGFFSALAALCIIGDTASGDPNVGSAMTLNSIAAVVLGGTALSGGKGNLIGSILGSLIIGLVGSLVFFVGTPSQWQNFVLGLSILGALMIGIFVSRRLQ
ncbi:MAG: ABC transporter permease [Psychromonas sp.]